MYVRNRLFLYQIFPRNKKFTKLTLSCSFFTSLTCRDSRNFHMPRGSKKKRLGVPSPKKGLPAGARPKTGLQIWVNPHIKPWTTQNDTNSEPVAPFFASIAPPVRSDPAAPPSATPSRSVIRAAASGGPDPSSSKEGPSPSARDVCPPALPGPR